MVMFIHQTDNYFVVFKLFIIFPSIGKKYIYKYRDTESVLNESYL